MISPKTVCFVYFALLFGMLHANSSSISISTPETSENATNNPTMTDDTTPDSTSTKTQDANSPATTTKTSVCTQDTPKLEEEGYCIFFLPAKYSPQLIIAALTVGCLVLLLTTLICTCQVCHLRAIISSLQPRYDKSDRRALREKSDSPYRDEGQVDGHPTESCLMLSEVTTTQEERREDEDNKTEEKKDMEQPSTEPLLKDPNGDVTQENNPEPDSKAPENSDTGV